VTYIESVVLTKSTFTVINKYNSLPKALSSPLMRLCRHPALLPPVDEPPSPVLAEAQEPEKSRLYDASILGELEAVTGKEARRWVWEKLVGTRAVYLGEADITPNPDDRALKHEIVKGLEACCADARRGLALVLEAFRCDLQHQLDQFKDGRRYYCSPSMF
jgi:hypothetical protein